MLDKYTDTKNYDVLAVQESETTDEDKLKITNMQVVADDNCSRNKGSVLYINNKYSITKLKEINQISKNIDTSWGVTVIHNKRFIVGSLYMIEPIFVICGP